MALTVSIQKGATSYSLKVDVVEHTFNRPATQSGLPGDYSTKQPSAIVIDLGICVEQISLTGIVDDSGSPSKYDLENVLRTWWEFGDTPTTMTKLTLKSGQSYYGAFKAASFRWIAGQEDRWEFSMIFLVYQKA